MATGYDFSRLKILVVDDNRFMRETVRAILNAFGINQVQSASEVDKAWSMLAEFRPDICLIDWRMEHGPDGISLVKRIRSDPTSVNHFMPVIMLTGNAEARHVVEARDSGINLYLAKPISAETLYNRLVGAVEQAKPFVRTMQYFGPDRRGRTRADYAGPKRRETDREAAE
jgi:CheY-like chemotaxis protein